MNPLFIYLLKASATVFILWAFYALCLRRMTFHRLNRYFFLGGILISLLWPALPLTEWFSRAPQVNQVVVYLPISAFMNGTITATEGGGQSGGGGKKPDSGAIIFLGTLLIAALGGISLALIRSKADSAQ